MRGTLPWANPLVPAHHKGRRAYGVRDTLCVRCRKTLRKADINAETQECAWCAWERLPAWQKQLMTDSDVVR